MGMRFRWWLLIAGLLWAPIGASAQDVPSVDFTGPLSHTPYDGPGVYVWMRALYMKTNQALHSQEVAKRGIYDRDGALTNKLNAFVGMGEGFNVSQLYGPSSSQPGWDLAMGYRFENGVIVELRWRHLVQARYTAIETIFPPTFNSGAFFENTFLSSPVSNFTADWAGNAQNIPGGTSATIFGIWNAASYMSIELTQRYDVYDINVRAPIWQTATHRTYGLFGPRIAWVWDRFAWRTVDEDINGNSGPDTTAVYSNTVSNRMYGIHFGCGNDWYLGHTPIGGFAFNLDVEGGLYLNLVKTHVAWERGDRAVSATRARRLNTLVPGAEVHAGLKWYPWEGISIEVGYDIQTYFNTISSPRPIDFNMGSIDPEFEHQFFRWFYGINAGISFVF